MFLAEKKLNKRDQDVMEGIVLNFVIGRYIEIPKELVCIPLELPLHPGAFHQVSVLLASIVLFPVPSPIQQQKSRTIEIKQGIRLSIFAFSFYLKLPLDNLND
jgi:hypothetical protein